MIGAVLLILLGLFAIIHWEINRTKREMIDKAKSVITQEKIDSTAKKAGRFMYEVKSFKNKIKAEEQRLQDSSNIK